MALTGIDDIDRQILYRIDFKTLIRSASVNKHTNCFLQQFIIYQELTQLKNLSDNLKFGTTAIIEQYYQLGLLGILSYHKFRCCNGFQLAVNHGQLAVLDWLWQSNYIQWYICVDVDAAITKGNIPVLEWLCAHHYLLDYDPSSINDAVRNGYLEIIQWLHLYQKLPSDTNVADLAAETGNIAALEWFRITLRGQYDYTANAIDMAAGNGHLSVLEWFDQIPEYKFIYTSYAIDYAAKNGHTDVLEWFHKSDYKFVYTNRAINFAAGNGQLNVLDWFEKSMYRFKYTSDAIDAAAKNGHINILNWFHESEYKFVYTNNAINFAAQNGHIHVLEWFRSRYRFKCTSKAIIWAAAAGHTEVLEWFAINEFDLINKRTVINDAFNEAAEKGHLATINWISENTTKPGRLSRYGPRTLSLHTVDQILKTGKLLILKYLYQNNYLTNIDQEMVSQIAKHGQIQLLDWFSKTSINMEINEYVHVSQSMIWGCPAVLDWFKKNGFAIIYKAELIQIVVARGHLNVLQWCQENNISIKYPNNVISIALSHEQYHVAEWLYRLHINLEFIGEHVHDCIINDGLVAIRWLTMMGYHFDDVEYSLAEIIEEPTATQREIIAWYQSENFNHSFIEEKFALAKKINSNIRTADEAWLDDIDIL